MTDTIEDSIQRLDKQLLELLLTDRSTNRHIVWATGDYAAFGEYYAPDCEIEAAQITDSHATAIKPRVTKAREEQNSRTRDRAEVFTPSWICNMQNNLIDEQWFGRSDVFNTAVGKKWKAVKGKISFPAESGKTWQDYVRAKRMEITCGESPYLVSRYDTVTGQTIRDVHKRIGLLDRKLRIINENTDNERDWLAWVKRAYQSIYGFEFQGDSLLLARANLLITFADNMIYKFHRQPTVSELRQISYIISWNLWQMDGLSFTAPYSASPCIIRDWANKHYAEYRSLADGGKGKKIAFDAVVGNPPYQLTNAGDGKGKDPIYHLFIDSARLICKRGTFIHPARFLFNAGKTPKSWNEKLLNDTHFKVVDYWADTSLVFSSVEIKGGVAITYWDETQSFGAIGIFSPHKEIKSILSKVLNDNFLPFSELVYPRDLYRLTEELYSENEWAVGRTSKGHKYDVSSNVFNTFPELFSDEKPQNGDEYAAILGRAKNNRILKWIKRNYIKAPDNFAYYKVFIPKANGAGSLGELLSTPVLGEPFVGHTLTFLSIGNFKSEYEANSVLKYIKTKFVRIMLGTLKVTQDNPRETWMNVPLQDFTAFSDIDWSSPVDEIDRQLYKKYSLTDEEIGFIERTAKPMN